eukprot:GHVR01150205.1.p1 GENE.GHVR01150205.1~~GHVR01150205.1.p1  ORF type:complete len:239 (+),score=10.27 GHVR01150205.1:275-991(+)
MNLIKSDVCVEETCRCCRYSNGRPHKQRRVDVYEYLMDGANVSSKNQMTTPLLICGPFVSRVKLLLLGPLELLKDDDLSIISRRMTDSLSISTRNQNVIIQGGEPFSVQMPTIRDDLSVSDNVDIVQSSAIFSVGVRSKGNMLTSFWFKCVSIIEGYSLIADHGCISVMWTLNGSAEYSIVTTALHNEGFKDLSEVGRTTKKRYINGNYLTTCSLNSGSNMIQIHSKDIRANGKCHTV